MGDPKRIRKKFVRSKIMWDRNRIDHDHELKERYGLKNIRELWKASTEVTRIRKNARLVLSNQASESVGREMIARLSRYNIIGREGKLDDLLGVTPEAILSRRLQSIIAKTGMAKTHKQARQLIVHGFISINGRKVKSPGYLVTADEEPRIGYYKPIDINPPNPAQEKTAQGRAAQQPAQPAHAAPAAMAAVKAATAVEESAKPAVQEKAAEAKEGKGE